MLRSPVLFFLALMLAGPVPGWAASGQIDAALEWNDNATNGSRADDRLGALQWRADLRLAGQRVLPGGQRLRAAAILRVEQWPRFEGLDFAAPGVAFDWQWKPGLGAHRPVFALETEGEWAAARESGRSGWGAAGRAVVRQRLSAATRITLGHEWRRFDARSLAFDRTGREWFARLEFDVGETWTFALLGRRRVGDVVSYSRPPRPDLEALGKPIKFVDTFEQAEPWIAYYFEAETRGGAVEVSRQWPRLRLALQHEYRATRHAGLGYRNRLSTLQVAFAF